jgi:hypothetical protein
LTLNASSSKALYRSACALVALERAEEAIDCCTRFLAFDQNKAINVVLDRARKLKAAQDKKEQERKERLRKEHELNLAYKVSPFVAVLSCFYLQSRNLVVTNSGAANPYSPHFDSEVLVFPVFFLYPQYATSDIIAEFAEDTPFATHLEVMFPPQAPHPDWDSNHEYTVSRLVVYAMTKTMRVLKIGKKMNLKDVFKAAKDGLELKDGCLSFVVLPKGQTEQNWVEEYKRTRDFSP